VLLNSCSGAIALLALPLYLRLLSLAGDVGFEPAEQIALFHTTFTVVGVALILPSGERYAQLISRIVSDPGPRLTRFLDTSVKSVPAVAVEAARRTVVEIAREVAEVSRWRLEREGSVRRPDSERIQTASQALAQARTFLAGIRSSPEIENDYARHLSVLHAIDHVERLIEAVEEIPDHRWPSADSVLDEAARNAAIGLAPALEWLAAGASTGPAPDLESVSWSGCFDQVERNSPGVDFTGFDDA
jgi:phosphate:Na+ symporter